MQVNCHDLNSTSEFYIVEPLPVSESLNANKWDD